MVLLGFYACRPGPRERVEPAPDPANLHRSETLLGNWTLLVRSDGPRWLDAAWWRLQGLDPEKLEPGWLRLMREGMPVPFLWLDAPDGHGLLFLGEVSPAEPAAAYSLSIASGSPEEVEVSSPLARPELEPGDVCQTTTSAAAWHAQELVFRSTAPLDPPFLWASLRPPESLTHSVVLTGVLSSYPITLTLRVWGQSSMPENPDHHVRVTWNTVVVDDHFWDGAGVETWHVRLPSSDEHENVLVISAPGGTEAEIDQSWLIGYSLSWQRALTPLEEGWQSWVAASESHACWTIGASVEERAAYVALMQGDDGVVTPVRLEAPDEGSSVRVPQRVGDRGWIGLPWTAPPPERVRSRETLSEDEFQDVEYLAVAPQPLHAALSPLLAARSAEGYVPGLVTPEAVYDTFGAGRPGAEAIRTMVRALATEGRLRYLLLVGDTTPDPAVLWDAGRVDVPTEWVRTAHVGYSASDFALVIDAMGEPLVAIGRFPVSAPEQLRTLVAKTLAWQPNDRVLVFTDDEPPFAELGRQLTAIQEVSLHMDAATFEPPSGARDALLTWLRQGPGTMVYVGHASMGMLGAEKFLVAEDAGWGPAMVVTWSCLCASFAHPSHTSLAERWLTQPTGAVAVIGPTGETTTAEQAAMALTLQQGLAEGETAGRALLRAWRAAPFKEARHGFLLLGDPALRPVEAPVELYGAGDD